VLICINSLLFSSVLVILSMCFSDMVMVSDSVMVNDFVMVIDAVMVSAPVMVSDTVMVSEAVMVSDAVTVVKMCHDCMMLFCRIQTNNNYL